MPHRTVRYVLGYPDCAEAYKLMCYAILYAFQYMLPHFILSHFLSPFIHCGRIVEILYPVVAL